MLPGEANAAANFVRSKLGSKVTIRGNEIQIDAERSDEVKLLIKKYLHREGLEAYRVLSESGVIRVVQEETQEPRKDVDYKVKRGSTVPTVIGGTFTSDANSLLKLRILANISFEEQEKTRLAWTETRFCYGGAGGI